MTLSRLGRFRIATTGGRSISQDDFLGRPALFFGWASWDPSRESLAEVEAFHREHGPAVTVASIAFDAEGPGHPMRYYRAAGCAHLPLIDATFTLSRAWGVKKVPFWVLADAEGGVQTLGDAFSLKVAAAALEKPSRHARSGESRSRHRFEKFEFLVQQVGIFLSRARTEDAVRCLREAEELDPSNALIKPQRLAVAHPEKFYSGPIDLKWLSSQS
jgi:hypothetical protein